MLATASVEFERVSVSLSAESPLALFSAAALAIVSAEQVPPLFGAAAPLPPVLVLALALGMAPLCGCISFG